MTADEGCMLMVLVTWSNYIGLLQSCQRKSEITSYIL